MSPFFYAMNIRLKKYRLNRMKGMNKYNAAREAGYSESYAMKFDLDKNVSTDMRNALERRGLTDKFLADYAMQGLNATVCIKGVEFPHWAVRHRFFETICKITGRMKDKLEITDKDGHPLPTPIINIVNAKNTTNNVLCTEEGAASS